MSEIIKQRMSADVDGEFAVFLIGLRINKLWKVHQWLPIAKAMPKMLTELYAQPELGLLGHEQWVGRTSIMVQYWKSFEHLENYAKNRSASHLPAWSSFNKKVGSNGDVGIWHETYTVSPENYEAIYNNMPSFGLAKASKAVPANGKLDTARARLKRKNNH